MPCFHGSLPSTLGNLLPSLKVSVRESRLSIRGQSPRSPNAVSLRHHDRMPASLTYLEWNDALGRHFFSEEKVEKEVLLFANEPLIQELGQPCDAGMPEFVSAVKAGPSWTKRTGLCEKALEALDGWRERELAYPPYIAYLALFVIAAGREGNFAPHAYYPRLRDLLGEPGERGAPRSFDGMIRLWEDLEKWSREDQQERLGRFVARIRGGWWKVGLPLSQTLISEKERKRLPLLLSERGLDPSDLPSPEVILRLLQEAGGAFLQRRTLRLLASEEEGDITLRNALAEVVIEELEDWDGTVTGRDDGGADSGIWQTRTTLRLCLKHDRVAQRVTCHVRIKAGAPYPEDGCTFVRNNGESWMCTERFNGWSNVLRDDGTSPPRSLSGATLDWIRGEQVTDAENRWTATLRPASIRVFTPGMPEGLPDWIERQRLERSTPFLITASGTGVRRVREWGTKYCSGFREHRISGLPDRWVLFSGENARESCQGEDILTVSQSIRLLLRGGIKMGRGNTYLKAVPPDVILANAQGTERITLDGEELKKNKVEGVWRIPDDAPVDKALHIEAHTQEQVHRRVLRLEEPYLPLRHEYNPFRRDALGRACSDSPLSVRGAVVAYPPGERPPAYQKELPLHLSKQLTLLGERPGEIAIWRRENFPEWHPVWAIIKWGRKRAQAVFCGTDEQATRAYAPPRQLENKALVRAWKQAVWYRRNRVKPPVLCVLMDRWREYVEVARNVR